MCQSDTGGSHLITEASQSITQQASEDICCAATCFSLSAAAGVFRSRSLTGHSSRDVDKHMSCPTYTHVPFLSSPIKQHFSFITHTNPRQSYRVCRGFALPGRDATMRRAWQAVIVGYPGHCSELYRVQRHQCQPPSADRPLMRLL